MAFGKFFTLQSLLPGCLKPKNLLTDPTLEASSNKISLRRISSISDMSVRSSLTVISDLSSSCNGSNLQIFTFKELKDLTQDFAKSNYLGEGGFGPVYKGFVDEKFKPGLKPQHVAVKILDLDGSQGHREWLAEVFFLGQLRHPNLVNLIGYCFEDEQRLLVYEFMEGGNLENLLFTGCYVSNLSWLQRMKIALGAAKGLAFLHEAEKPIIFRDFKASNILLDSNYNSKLSDFGLATDGPEGNETHVTTTRVMGTEGYAAPEYIMTGHLSTMSDVFSFGVFLLELLTGRRAVDKSRPSREQNLVVWGRHLLKDPHKLEKIMDPRLEGEYSNEGAKKVAAIAYLCLSHHPRCRPTMKSVVKNLEAVLHMKEFLSQPFVYIAPSEEKKEAVAETKKINKEVLEVEVEVEMEEKRPKSRRHRRWVPSSRSRSGAVHSY